MPNKPSPYEPTGFLAKDGGPRRKNAGALVCELQPGGPAQREGLEVGMLVTHVNGTELHDMIDWDWEADGPFITLEGVAHPGTEQEFEFVCDIERSWGEDWGVTFDGAVFDGMRLCRNDCLFCFMKMLPPNMRKTLYMRDDDYRLSFLQGNFVTLTNMRREDVERVVACALSPLNVSLHAVTPSVRECLMGKHAHRGIEVLEELLEAGIEVHAQIVLVPDVNDGAELKATLDFVESRPGITSLGIVPLGFTKHQDVFDDSFNDPHKARAVIEAVRPYQERSRALTGRTRFQLADEFYLSAQVDVPAEEHYDGYPQFHDGIGMVRSFVEDAKDVLADDCVGESLLKARQALDASHGRVYVVTGEAARPVLDEFVNATPLEGACEVLAVHNDFFGGNVDVAGLLTAQDVLAQLPANLTNCYVVLPDVMLNADLLTLDGVHVRDLENAIALRGGKALVTAPGPRELVMCLCGV